MVEANPEDWDGDQPQNQMHVNQEYENCGIQPQDMLYDHLGDSDSDVDMEDEASQENKECKDDAMKRVGKF